jgi:ABC-type transport system involved in multi-copper enzyme maturation permease subunit
MLLPILSKELIELAGRRQTYLTRVIYALALFGLFWFLFRSMGMRDGSMLDLGKGSELLRNLFLLQVASIYLLVPPIISTSITEEKEKGTIITLVSLPMRSSAILLQKLFGRLLPVLTMLALCFPL